MNAMPKTDARLLERMEQSAKQPRTKDEIARQRISYVYGNLPSESAITRAQVEEHLRKKEGV